MLFSKLMIIKFSEMVDRRNINSHPLEFSISSLGPSALGMKYILNSLGWKFIFLRSTISENFIFFIIVDRFIGPWYLQPSWNILSAGFNALIMMMFLSAALDIKRHHQNESKTKEVIFPLEEPCQQMSELPQNFWRTNAQKR